VLDPLNGADATKGYSLLKPMGKIIHFGDLYFVESMKRLAIDTRTAIANNNCIASIVYLIKTFTKQVSILDLYPAQKLPRLGEIAPRCSR